LPDEATFPRYFLWICFVTVNLQALLVLSAVSYKSNFNHNENKIFTHSSKQPNQFVSKANWWTPVWNGILLEPDAKHYKAMGRALWLYLYLLTFANRTTGKLFRRLPTIAKDTGIGIRTIRRWLKQLKQNGYIETHQTGRYLKIEITKWKPIKK
jgi:DNA-binding transcriptional ArsR family regulator